VLFGGLSAARLPATRAYLAFLTFLPFRAGERETQRDLGRVLRIMTLSLASSSRTACAR